MIHDKITNIHLYSNISPAIDKALKYLQETDFSLMKPGKKEIYGNDIYCIISSYETKALEDCRLEAHHKHIDIHYMAEGSEIIGFSIFNNQQEATKYDSENDFILYCGEKNYIKLEQGKFAIFFPTDLHMPGIMIGQPAMVKKIVVKVKAELFKYAFI